ncbi:MAG: glutamine amidotransferase [Firmicutes bacterium]|nr:glutamine amidotransferase [Bacillota bacterium]
MEAGVVRILVAGESWQTTAMHVKGVDLFGVGEYTEGAEAWLHALRAAGEVDYLPAHRVPAEFPTSLEGLMAYDVVFLSDIGANSLLLHPDTWLRGRRTANRLKLLKEFVERGGGLGMVGGYLSFSGLAGRAAYHGTAVEEVLPVDVRPYDDRLEAPEGADPRVVEPDHYLVRGLGEWPYLLGLNRLKPKPGARTLVEAAGEPLLVVQAGGTAGAGRTLAWASDIGPHWCPEEFVAWPGYATLWRRAARWLAGEEEAA